MEWTQRQLLYFPVSILRDVAWCSSLPFYGGMRSNGSRTIPEKEIKKTAP
jgi:hypothetical protein